MRARSWSPNRPSPSIASSVPADPPTTPRPQLSQRRTGAPRRSSSASQPKSGSPPTGGGGGVGRGRGPRGGTHRRSASPQGGRGGFSGPAPASSGTVGARVVNSSMRCSVRARAKGHPELNRPQEAVLAWESRWSLPPGLLTFVAVVILIVSAIVIAGVNGTGEAELLVSAKEHASAVTISSVLEAIGFLILVAPLYVLFRAALARAPDRIKSQLVGVIVVAP